jgi:hypothetical protein
VATLAGELADAIVGIIVIASIAAPAAPMNFFIIAFSNLGFIRVDCVSDPT